MIINKTISTVLNLLKEIEYDFASKGLKIYFS